MKEMVGGCCVCSDERGWAENPLVYCDGHACSVAVHQGKAEGGGGRRGAAGPRGRRAHRVPSAAPSGALLGRVPLPHPPEAKGGVGSPPAWSSRTGSGIVFLPIVPVPRPPPQVEGVLGRVQGARSELPDTRTAGVGAVLRMFTCEVSPPPPGLFWFPLREEEVKGGGHPPLLPDAGRSGIGKGGEGSHGRRDS